MIDFQILHISEVSSTNTVALEEASRNAEEGLVILTDYQTAGRGKPGKAWISPKDKNLLFSVLLRPPLRPDQAPLLTQIACRAVVKTLKEKYSIAPIYKWPNDLMVNSKKICGTLVEAASSSRDLEAVVIGIGLNVNASADEIPEEAVSMSMLTGKTYSKEVILEEILKELDLKLEELYTTGTIN